MSNLNQFPMDARRDTANALREHERRILQKRQGKPSKKRQQLVVQPIKPTDAELRAEMQRRMRYYE